MWFWHSFLYLLRFFFQRYLTVKALYQCTCTSMVSAYLWLASQSKVTSSPSLTRTSSTLSSLLSSVLCSIPSTPCSILCSILCFILSVCSVELSWACRVSNDSNSRTKVQTTISFVISTSHYNCQPCHFVVKSSKSTFSTRDAGCKQSLFTFCKQNRCKPVFV